MPYLYFLNHENPFPFASLSSFLIRHILLCFLKPAVNKIYERNVLYHVGLEPDKETQKSLTKQIEDSGSKS